MELEKLTKLEKKFKFFKSQEEIETKLANLKKIKEAATVLGISLFVYFLIFATLSNETIYTKPYIY